VGLMLCFPHFYVAIWWHYFDFVVLFSSSKLHFNDWQCQLMEEIVDDVLYDDLHVDVL
jgi:hypothetical protein